jgi:Tol biopolymer transport system component
LNGDYKGVTERVLVDNSTIHIALRWNRNPNHPLLLYSECTPRNVRLCVVTMQGHKRIVSNFDGINMQASYAPDEQHVVVCLARNGNSDLYKFHFDTERHKGVYEQLTTDGSFFDPWWADNDRIYFSSDAVHEHEPSIGYLDPETKKVTWITTQGYCTTPVYCGKNRLLAYLKRIDGNMQIMLYDERANKHSQLTKDNSSKSTCSWSVCGNYLVVAVEDNKGRRIALCNAANGQFYPLTGDDQICYHPAWHCPSKL